MVLEPSVRVMRMYRAWWFARFRLAVYRCKTMMILDRDNKYREMHYLDTGWHDLESRIPLLFLPGTCQTIETWQVHVNKLTTERGRLLIPELRCMGTRTKLMPEFDSMNDYATDIEAFLSNLNVSLVDVAGFSLGGRMAMALAVHKPHLVRKLSVTGVPYKRTAYSEKIIESWKEGLSSECCFRATAWSCVLNGFSPSYVSKNSPRIRHFVDRIIKNNDYRNLKTILFHSHDDEDKASVQNCALHLDCPVQVMGGAEDRIADIQEVLRLAEVIKASQEQQKIKHNNGGASHVKKVSDVDVHIIEGSGHSCPFEKPGEWQDNLLNFLRS